MQIAIPKIIFVDNGSAKTSVPTRIPVMGSKAPKTEVLVGPMRRVDSAMVSMEIIVGKIARPMRLTTSEAVSIPLVKGMSYQQIGQKTNRSYYQTIERQQVFGDMSDTSGAVDNHQIPCITQG